MPEAILTLEHLCKTYGSGETAAQVLFDISLTIAKGEFSALMGPSGSGKTTLLNILGALDRPTSGSISASGVELSSLDDNSLADYRNRSLGFIFQFHHLLPEFSAIENVLIPYRIANGSVGSAVEKRAHELLDLVGVGNRKTNRATDLSGGQQQRVAIARSLINNPPLILADEPTGNLDSETGEQILALMRSINVSQGTTFLIVTHDRNIAGKCDRILELKDGRMKV